jgi:hypothetical protein
MSHYKHLNFVAAATVGICTPKMITSLSTKMSGNKCPTVTKRESYTQAFHRTMLSLKTSHERHMFFEMIYHNI